MARTASWNWSIEDHVLNSVARPRGELGRASDRLPGMVAAVMPKT